MTAIIGENVIIFKFVCSRNYKKKEDIKMIHHKKKKHNHKWNIALLICLSFSVLCSCAPTETNHENESEEENSIENTTKDDNEEKAEETNTETHSYQEQYRNLILSLTDDYAGYGLLNIDNDDVPELILIGNTTAQGDRLFSIVDGELTETILSTGGLIYWECQGIFQDENGRMDSFWNNCYEIKNGVVTKTHEGLYTMDTSGTYTYYWDGSEVSSKDYFDRLSEYSGTGISFFGYDKIISKEELLSQLDNSSTKQILRKNVDGTLNVRSQPQHDSELVGTIDSSSELLYYEGMTVEGVGSDGNTHNWHRITTSSGLAGWVRADYVASDTGSIQMSDQSLHYYRKGVDGALNIRSQPRHDSELVGTVYTQDEPLVFYGEIGTGYGSDGIIHEWYKITTSDGITGWVRSDLIWREEG